MNKRARWLLGLGVLVPGSAQVLAGNRKLGRFALGATLMFWVLVLVAATLVILARDWLFGFAAQAPVLLALAGLCVFFAVLWLVLTVDTLRLLRLVCLSLGARFGLSLAVMLALAVSFGVPSYLAVSLSMVNGALGTVFAGERIEEPVDGRYNILLLGGDASQGRVGLRPDSISVASVDAETGAVVLIGIPRNLQNTPFPEGSPMLELYPDGFSCGADCLIDYVYFFAEENSELYPQLSARGATPGMEAMREAVSAVLGIQVQYTVLVDMQGFADLIDALGGIEIIVAEPVPLGVDRYEDGTPAPPVGVIEPGMHLMNGTNALSYVRSRYGSNDYERMERQRQVQQAILAQADPATVLTRFSAIAEAGAQIANTDIPRAMLSHFVSLAQKSREHPVVSYNFVPPDYDSEFPDFPRIQLQVQELLNPDDLN